MTQRRRRLLTALIATLMLVTVAFAAIRIRAAWPGFDSLFARAASIVEPAPLAAAHHDLEGTKDCRSCHATTTDIPNSRCLNCHQEIGDRIAGAIGFHGKELTGNCAQCHRDHRSELIVFDRAKFNHRQATFPLVEKHATLECEACHRKQQPAMDPVATPRFDFLGLAHERCEDCHRDPHQGTLTSDDVNCEHCHDQTAFTGRHLAFEHGRDSSFPLRGAHASLACAKCHTPSRPDAPLAEAKFRGLGKTCADCHQDPHRGTLTSNDRNCTECHDESGWTGRNLEFDHSKVTAFPLRGKHANVACSQCHKDTDASGRLATADFATTATTCASCHADPHAGQFQGADCATCHRESGFRQPDVLFRHASVDRFPLTGAHADVACAQCHIEKGAASGVEATTFRGLSSACSTCHLDPHVAGTSASRTTRARPELADPALADQRASDASDCARCHDTKTFRGAQMTFDHAKMSNFTLDETHRSLSCTECHSTLVFRPTPTTCAECHRDVSDAMAGRIELAGKLEQVEPSPHAGLVTCSQCHDTTKRNETFERLAEKCGDCHTPHYTSLALTQGSSFGERVARLRRAAVSGSNSKAAGTTDRDLDTLLRFAAHDFQSADKLLRLRFEDSR